MQRKTWRLNKFTVQLISGEREMELSEGRLLELCNINFSCLFFLSNPHWLFVLILMLLQCECLATESNDFFLFLFFVCLFLA